MKKLTFEHASYLPRLMDELMAAIPALRPIMEDPITGVLTASFTLWGDGRYVTVQVPDVVADADVGAVIAAHDPAPPPPQPTQNELLAAAIADARAATTTVATLDEMKTVVTQLYDNLGTILAPGGQS